MLQSIKKSPCFGYDNYLKIKQFSVFATLRDIWRRVFWLNSYGIAQPGPALKGSNDGADMERGHSPAGNALVFAIYRIKIL